MTYTYQPWPSWAFGPNGESAIFQSEEDVPKGWTHHGETKGGKPQLDHDKDGKAGGSKAPDAAEGKEDLAGLREHYKKVVGKKPFGGWDADELRRRLDAAEGRK
jgi:hypothetical protein